EPRILLGASGPGGALEADRVSRRRTLDSETAEQRVLVSRGPRLDRALPHGDGHAAEERPMTTGVAVPALDLPWYRQVNATQWNAFLATFLGWTLDGFDFTILSFLIADIQKSFTVSAALAGALGTITLFFRVVGGSVAGSAADRWGRKPPL